MNLLARYHVARMHRVFGLLFEGRLGAFFSFVCFLSELLARSWEERALVIWNKEVRHFYLMDYYYPYGFVLSVCKNDSPLYDPTLRPAFYFFIFWDLFDV